MKFLGRFKFWGRNPLTIVEVIIAIASIVGGLYVLSPLLAYSTAVNGAGALVQLISHPLAIKFYGALYVGSGAIIIAGVAKRRYQWRSFGLFWNILIRSYTVIGTIIIQGVLPLTWLSNAVIICILLVCYTVVRGFLYRDKVE